MEQESFTDDGWYVAGTEGKPFLLLLPGLGVSYQIFFPLIELLKEEFRIYAFQVDGFTLGRCTRFDSIDGQAGRVIEFIRTQCGGRVDCVYGLSLGGKILSRVLERNEVTIDHAILDAAPLLPLPRWLEGPLRYYQSYNVNHGCRPAVAAAPLAGGTSALLPELQRMDLLSLDRILAFCVPLALL